MKAITILEPWASLIACGAKKIETRSWKTKYRGKIVIHAAKAIQDKLMDMAAAEPFKSALAKNTGCMKDNKTGLLFNPGHVIAIADLVDCVEINESHIHYLVLGLENGKSNEYVFGDFIVGRYAWILENVQRIEPVPAKGQQRIWNLDVSAVCLAAWHSGFFKGEK